MINDSMNYKRITIFAKDTQNDMKRFIGHTILILLAEIFLFCPITMSQNNPYKINDQLYSYYQKCNSAIRKPEVLLMADTLFHMAEKKGDVKAQCLALNLKSDHYYFINDINTFLIESYKIKIDHILANLNISLERVTNNDPVAQAKLLEKIRNDISLKIQVINSRSISENRKKILSSVFSYIQENLDAKISKLVQKK